MKSVLLLLFCGISVFSQTVPTPFRGYTSADRDPVFCMPGVTPLHWNTTTNTLKRCSAENTWAAIPDSAMGDPPISPLAYGADPTGVAVSTKAIQSAGFASSYGLAATGPITSSTGITVSFETGGGTVQSWGGKPLFLNPAGNSVKINGGSNGKGFCQKSDGYVGYCSTALDANGNCTCN